jgi:ABC-type uncharacterized transport system fused permease/ATPase subunit
LAALIPTLVKPLVDIGWFSWQLWRLTGRRGMAILYLYTLFGWGSLRLVTPDFGGLLKQEMFLEGAFRNAHARLRTHAESGECEGLAAAVICMCAAMAWAPVLRQHACSTP